MSNTGKVSKHNVCYIVLKIKPVKELGRTSWKKGHMPGSRKDG